jgi:hypothetical protein
LITHAQPRTPEDGPTIRSHVFPKSFVANTHGSKSPNVCRSNAAYAAPSACGPASTQETQLAGGRPGTFFTTFVQFAPPSLVSCTLPSSVPTQIVFASRGLSEIEKIVVCISAAELSTVIPPDCSCFCFSGSFVVRSGEIRCHDCPPSLVAKRNWDPM